MSLDGAAEEQILLLHDAALLLALDCMGDVWKRVIVFEEQLTRAHAKSQLQVMCCHQHPGFLRSFERLRSTVKSGSMSYFADLYPIRKLGLGTAEDLTRWIEEHFLQQKSADAIAAASLVLERILGSVRLDALTSSTLDLLVDLVSRELVQGRERDEREIRKAEISSKWDRRGLEAWQWLYGDDTSPLRRAEDVLEAVRFFSFGREFLASESEDSLREVSEWAVSVANSDGSDDQECSAIRGLFEQVCQRG